MKHVLVAALIFIASVGSTPASTKSNTVHVSATISANCVVRSPAGLDFGTYTSVNENRRPLKAKGKVLSIACTKGAVGVSIALDNGKHFSHDHRHLKMRGSREKVVYEIYTSARRNVVWNAANTVSYVPVTDQPAAISMYGKVPGEQRPQPGEYFDTLTATVNF